MKLSVYVLGREVAALESVGDFKSSMTYHQGVAPEDFVSLTMRVRHAPYLWDDVLHPIFQGLAGAGSYKRGSDVGSA